MGARKTLNNDILRNMDGYDGDLMDRNKTETEM